METFFGAILSRVKGLLSLTLNDRRANRKTTDANRDKAKQVLDGLFGAPQCVSVI